MQIVRKKLAPDQVTPATIRYNPDCDCVEQTWDGGATWTPTPGADPRSSPAFRAPANDTDQPQCNAAANMVSALRDMVDADVSADNQLALATLLLGTALLFVPVAGWIADAFLLVADAIILLDQATIEAAFTSTVYDDLLCTFFCYLDADGQMSDEQLTDFLSNVFENYDFIVWKVISNHSDTLGSVGWSNMGALGTGTGSDCSECDCDAPWCYTFDFLTSDGGWVARVAPDDNWGASWTAGIGWHGDLSKISWGIMFTLPTQDGTTCVRFLTAEGSSSEPDILATPCANACCDGGCTYTGEEWRESLPWGVEVGPTPCDPIDSGTQYLAMVIGGGAPVLTSLTLRGIGTNPFGADNC